MKSKLFQMMLNVVQLFVVIYVMIAQNSAKKKQSNVGDYLRIRIYTFRFLYFKIEIVKKYSNFVSAPIYINDTRVNNLRVCLRNFVLYEGSN